MKKNIKYLLLMVLGFGVFTSCSEDDLDPTLAQSKNINISINTLNDLDALHIGMMERISASAYYGRDLIILGEVFSDNTASNANSNRFVVEGQMNLNAQSAIASTLWSQIYEVIANANIIINAEGITGDQARIDYRKGQALAVRALAHFDLVKFYGQQHVNGGTLSSPGVPYVKIFRNEDDLFPSRNTVQEVRDMAYADLQLAKTLMAPELNSTNKEFISTHAVNAIEARIANYFGDHPRALTASKAVLDVPSFKVIENANFLNSFKIDNAANSIFEIAATPTDNLGINGLANIYQAGSYGDVIALPNLAAIYEEGDIRGATPYTQSAPASSVIGRQANGTLRNVGKYPSRAPFDDNIPVIRYEEMVLIYVEALIRTGGDLGEALVWLNKIPAARGASLYTEATIENVILERRKELAFEGFRFHDLARLKMGIPLSDPVLQTHGGPAYGSYKFALPIPGTEADVNSNIEQNEGY